LRVLYPYRCTDGVKFGTEEGTNGPILRAKFHPIGATSPPAKRKTSKSVSKYLKYLRVVLRAMLPVITI